MARHDPSSMSEGELLSVGEPSDSAEAAGRSEQLREQLKSSERLNEYYRQVVAELRASLDEIEQRDRAS
jgi:hypothetical protein